jgi:hypothetical protein
MSPARHYDDYSGGRTADSDDSPKSIRALSAFDKVDDATNGAASPTIPLRSKKHTNGGNVVEQIAYDPAFRNVDATRIEQPQIRPSARTSSPNRPW